MPFREFATEAQLLVEIGLILTGIIVAAVYIKSALVRQRHEELEDLAETRGQRVDDLKDKVADLSQRLATMEGKIEALEQLKVDQIVAGVVSGVREVLAES